MNILGTVASDVRRLCSIVSDSTSDMYQKLSGFNRLPQNMCKYCQQCFGDESQLDSHLETQHGVFTQRECHICSRMFKSRGGYKMHMKMYHGNVDSMPKCNICMKTFPCYARLKIHEKSHSEEKSYICTFCHHSFKYKQNLKTHRCKRD